VEPKFVVERLLTMGEGEQMTWVGMASLDDLKRAQRLNLNVLVHAALQARIADLGGSERSRRIFIVGVLTLVVALLTLVAAVAAVVVGVVALIVPK